MRKRLQIVVGICFLVAGVCYFLYPNFREWRTQQEVNTIIEEFEDNRDQAITSAEDTSSKSDDDTSETESKQESSSKRENTEVLKQTVMPDLYNALEQYNQDLIASGQQILDSWSYEQSPIDVKLLNNGSSVIGYIEAPDMDVKLPLYLGASSENLSKGAAVLTQTSMPIGGTSTNCVISGHRGYNGSAFFQHIEKMRVGSMVYITNPWETLTYQVVSTKIVTPSQVEDVMIQTGKDMVTLVSCHPYVVGGGPERYLVFCERVELDETSDTNTEMVTESQSESNQETTETMSSESVQIEYVEENNLQKCEALLRFLAPMGVVLIVCFILFIQYSKKM